jgi:hypothetical protein
LAQASLPALAQVLLVGHVVLLSGRCASDASLMLLLMLLVHAGHLLVHATACGLHAGLAP